jgi:hypothetical protein
MTDALIDGGSLIDERQEPNQAFAEASAPEQIEPAPASEPLVSQREDVDELDKLLAQWDEETKSATVSPPEPQPAPYDYSDQIRQASVQAWVDQEKLLAQQAGIERGFQLAQEYAELDRVTKSIVADTGAPVEMVNAYFDGLTNKNPQWAEQVRAAFAGRHSNPAAWERAISDAKKSFHKEWSSRPDPDLTEDRMAVASAVRGSVSEKSMPADPPPNLGHLSDAEYRRYLADIGVSGF